MKKLMIGILIVALSVMTVVPSLSYANVTENYGALGAKNGSDYSIEEMLEYALEDEYLAYAEYDLILNNFNVDRPVSNIIKAEQQHIQLLESIYQQYDYDLPDINPEEYIVLPDSLEEVYETGIEAEVNNIAMYEQFLAQNLPDDIQDAFEALKRASESHLSAFERNLDKTGTGNSFKTNNSQRGRQNR